MLKYSDGFRVFALNSNSTPAGRKTQKEETMLFDQIIKEIIPNADEAMTEDEIKKRIQEISQRRKNLNRDWVREAVSSTNKVQ
ncbi:hypothetical protein J5491_02155 [Candidatus Saccharibacteria bacterium]|nr:hypothetical protein [Candidatus Saccharibacteria bacterium]